MGFFKKVGKGIAKGVNKALGTNLSVGSSSGSSGGESTSEIEQRLYALIEKGAGDLVNVGVDYVEGQIVGAIDKNIKPKQTNSIVDRLGEYGSKILDSATTNWLKKNWWLVLVPIPVALLIYWLISNGKGNNRKKGKKWF